MTLDAQWAWFQRWAMARWLATYGVGRIATRLRAQKARIERHDLLAFVRHEMRNR